MHLFYIQQISRNLIKETQFNKRFAIRLGLVLAPLLLLCVGQEARAQMAPSAFTQAAGPVTTTNATLNGMVVPNGADTVAWFEWGTNSSYGQITDPVSVGNGSSVVRVSLGIRSLPTKGNFCCHLVASNSVGVTYGAPVLFTTGRKVMTWGDNSFGQTNVPVGIGNGIFVACGDNHSLFLKTDGTVGAWGQNNSGQTNVPAGLINVVAVAGGGKHSLALKSDGTVVAWGYNGAGQTNVPAGLSNAVAVSGGGNHSLALKNDGTLVAWGDNTFGQANVPAGLSNVVAVAGGGVFSLALKADGSVVAWGNNTSGHTNVPAGLSNVVAVAAGGSHSLALKSDGTIVAWGDNTFGQITVPTGLSNVVAVAGGGSHSLALKSDGTVAVWGWNYYGQTNVPTAMSNVMAVAGGQYHSLALGNLAPQAQGQTNSGVALADLTVTLSGSDFNGDSLTYRLATLPAAGTLYQWTPGGRGDPITAPNTVVTDVGGRVIFALPSSGSDSFTFVANDGLVDSIPASVFVNIIPLVVFTQPAQPAGSTAATLCGAVMTGPGTKAWFEWGMAGGYGQQTAAMDLPANGLLTRVTSLLTSLVPRANYQCRLVVSNSDGVTYGSLILFTTGRKVLAWGDNTYGQTNVPAGLSNVMAVAGGGNHSLALKPDGTVVAWGDNAYGQTTVPTGLINVVAVACGYEHSLALKSDGTVVVWGLNNLGQTNIPVGLSNVVAVSGGYGHNLALKADGTVVAWGDNNYGQSTVPAGLNSVLAVSAGSSHSLALKSDGTVVAWGDNSSGRTVVPTGLSNVVAVAGGTTYSLALKADGTAVSWFPANKVPSGLSNVLALAAGANHSLAMKADGTVVATGNNNYGQLNVPSGLSNVIGVAARGNHSLAVGNLPPQVQGQTNTVPAVQDLTFTFQGSDRDGDALTYRVATLPAVGSLYQWTVSGRGDPITTPNTPVTDAGGRVILSLPNVGSYSFSFVANDGLADSAPGAVLINATPVTAYTQPVQPAGTAAATLCGAVVGSPGMKVWFEWGLAGGYGQTTALMDVASPGLLTRVTTLLTNLSMQANYQCRVVASNASGVLYGAPVLFTTGQKVSAWGNNNWWQTTVPAGLSNVVSAAAGSYHDLCLKSDGTVAAWGENYNSFVRFSGQAIVPSGLSNVVAVSGGQFHSLALRSNGTVVSWGDNLFGQTNVPVSLSEVVAVADGEYHSLALKANGTIVAWSGWNNFGQATIPNGLSNVLAIAAGRWHSLALKSDGTVVAWGDPTYGKTIVPSSLSNVVSIAGGENHSLALKADGTVVAWGYNNFGQAPVTTGLSNIVAVAAGGNHSLALKSDGAVVAWGYNNYGQTNVPLGLSNVAVVTGGYEYSLAVGGNLPPQAQGQTNFGVVLADLAITLTGADPNTDPLTYRVATLPAAGTLYQWTPSGRGSAITAPSTPVADAGGRVIYNPTLLGSDIFTFVANDGVADSAPASVMITAGPSWAYTQPARPAGSTSITLCGMALAGTGTKVWFEWSMAGGYRQQTAVLDLPANGPLTRVTTLLTNLVPRANYQCRLVASNSLGLIFGSPVLFTTGRKVMAWGDNAYGQTTIPAGLSNAMAVSGGTAHSVALTSDGAVVAWGDNSYGQTTVPAGLGNVVAVAGGFNHNLAITSDGGVVSWGANASGQTNVPVGLSNVVAVAGGSAHSLALVGDGTVVAWGDNAFGQSSVPVGLNNVVAVAAGAYHNLALKADGTLVAWGQPFYGQTFSPPGLSGVAAMAGGNTYSLALKVDGTAVAWGQNGSVPSGLSNMLAVAGGSSHSLALNMDGTVVGWGANASGQTNVPVGLSNVVAVAGGGSHSLALGNLPPLAQSQTNSGLALADLALTLSGTDANTDPLNFRVATLPLAGTLYQWTPSGRGAAITTPNTPVTDAGGRVIFSLPTSGSDSFTFVANDGLADSTPAVATLYMIQPPMISTRSSGLNADGSFSLGFTADPNVNWRVWCSTNLTSWDVLGAATQTSPSVFLYTDTGATNRPIRFYRLTSP